MTQTKKNKKKNGKSAQTHRRLDPRLFPPREEACCWAGVGPLGARVVRPGHPAQRRVGADRRQLRAVVGALRRREAGCGIAHGHQTED